MVDSKKNYKFDLGGKGLTHGIKFSQLEGLPIVQSVQFECCFDGFY